MSRFSEVFNLGKSQAELDFVDIPLNADIRLFVDPYALSISSDPWIRECSDIVVDFFQKLVDSMRAGDETRAKEMLSHLREPNDTHLGMSSGLPAGRGVGPDQADDLYQRLSASKVMKSGKLQDLSDAELHIPNIGSDKISDITINIIRRRLIAYTYEQCQSLGIPTRQVASGMYWEEDHGRWANAYVDLPANQQQRIVLVPKAAVRYRLSTDHQKYYQHFVLEYLQAEHLSAGSSLVEVLKNGKRRVTKKSLKENFPLDKDRLFEFSEAHPAVLKRYKSSLRSTIRPLSNEDIEAVQPDPRNIDVSELITELEGISTGNSAASSFHSFIFGALETIFYPSLRRPVKEQEINEGRKRVDIVFNNGADAGFFHDLSIRHGIQCPYVFFECKNYGSDLANPEFDQLTSRFSDKRGMFGILVCRKNENVDAILKRCRDIVNANRGFVLVLDDEDIKALLTFRAQGKQQQIDNYMDDKFRQLVL